ncbi:DUF6292 family protein [Saccharothrix sp. DSM 118769]
MGLDFDDTVTRALRRYARSVTSALGLGGDCWCVQDEHQVGIYLALDGRLGSHPGHDVALLWDERHGWSAVVETDGGEDVVVGRLDGLAVPRAGAVAAWVADLFRRSAADARRDDQVTPDALPRAS